MSERRTHAQKAAGFVKEMLGFVEVFKKATPCSREHYRDLLLVNQACWSTRRGSVPRFTLRRR
jgi:hypothetical protein